MHSSTVYLEPVSGHTVLDVTSRKHGRFLTSIDPEDANLVRSHTWSVRLAANGLIYFATSYQTPGGKRASYQLHHLITKAPAGAKVDHRQPHNTMDNRKSNLRHASIAENVRNRRPVKNSSSRYKGVSLHKRSRMWRARIKTNDRNINLGWFPATQQGEIDAAKAYDRTAAELHGEFAWLNRDHFPEVAA